MILLATCGYTSQTYSEYYAARDPNDVARAVKTDLFMNPITKPKTEKNRSLTFAFQTLSSKKVDLWKFVK